MAKKSFSDMTPEQRREYGRIGGIKSAQVKKEKRAMKETLDILLSMPLKDKKCYDVEDIKNFAALKGKNISIQDAILIAQVQKALHGDLNSAEFIRDTSGQKPKDGLDISGSLPVVISGEERLED